MTMRNHLLFKILLLIFFSLTIIIAMHLTKSSLQANHNAEEYKIKTTSVPHANLMIIGQEKKELYLNYDFSNQINEELNAGMIDQFLSDANLKYNNFAKDLSNYLNQKYYVDAHAKHLVYAVEKKLDKMIWADIVPRLDQDSPISNYVLSRIRQWEDDPQNIQVLDVISSRLLDGGRKNMINAHSFSQSYKSYGLNHAIQLAQNFGNASSQLQFLELAVRHVTDINNNISNDQFNQEVEEILNYADSLGPYRRYIFEQRIEDSIKNKNLFGNIFKHSDTQEY